MAGAGYKLFNTGDVLTAAQVNTYLQEQAVMRFANATARTTALSGVLAEGMMSYLDDTNSVEVYNGSAWVSVGSTGDITGVTAGTGLSGGGTSGDVTLSLSTPVSATNGGTAQTTYTTGDILYASASNTLAKRAIGTTGQVLTVSGGVPTWATASGGFGTLTAYTPTWTGITQGNGTFTNVGYSESGDAVWYYGLFTVGSTTSFTGVVSLSLPVNAKPDGGNVVIRQAASNMSCVTDTSTGYTYPLMTGVQNANPSTRLTFWTTLANQTYLQNQAQEFQQTVPITVAQGDEIFWNVIYRKA